MNDEIELRGEYWIQDGFVDFADGDIGDLNHESIAIQYVFNLYAEKVQELASSLGIEGEIERYGEVDIKAVQKLIYEIEELDEEIDIIKALGIDREGFLILSSQASATKYVMRTAGWIAVRGNNIELYGYNEKKRKSLARGLNEIVEQERIGDDVPPEQIDFSIFDHKTGKSYNVTLADIENPQPVVRPQQMPTTVSKKPIALPKDAAENTPGAKGQPNQWDVEAKKRGLLKPGQQLWRVTSESFKEWLIEGELATDNVKPCYDFPQK